MRIKVLLLAFCACVFGGMDSGSSIPLPQTIKNLKEGEVLDRSVKLILKKMWSLCGFVESSLEDDCFSDADAAKALVFEIKSFLSGLSKLVNSQEVGDEIFITYGELEGVFNRLGELVGFILEPTQGKLSNILLCMKKILEGEEEYRANLFPLSDGILQQNELQPAVRGILREKEYRSLRGIKPENFEGQDELDFFMQILRGHSDDVVADRELLELMITTKHKALKSFTSEDLRQEYLRDIYLVMLYQIKVNIVLGDQVKRLAEFIASLSLSKQIEIKLRKDFLRQTQAWATRERGKLSNETADSVVSFTSDLEENFLSGLTEARIINDQWARERWREFKCKDTKYMLCKVFQRALSDSKKKN